MKKRIFQAPVYSRNNPTSITQEPKFDFSDINWGVVVLAIWTVVVWIGIAVACVLIPSTETQEFVSNNTRLSVNSGYDVIVKSSNSTVDIRMESGNNFNASVNDAVPVSSTVDETWAGNTSGQVVNYLLESNSEVFIVVSEDNISFEITSESQSSVELTKHFIGLFVVIPVVGFLVWLVGLLIFGILSD